MKSALKKRVKKAMKREAFFMNMNIDENASVPVHNINDDDNEISLRMHVFFFSMKHQSASQQLMERR